MKIGKLEITWDRRSLHPEPVDNTETQELRSLLKKIYEWSAYKHTKWARRCAAALSKSPKD